MTTLSKVYTRSYSLFCVAGWCESGTQHSEPWVGQNDSHVFFINDGQGKKFSVWYDLSQNFWEKNIEKRINADPEYFSKAKKDFYEHLPWVMGKNTIETFADFKEFYRHYILWWLPMAIILEVPNIKVPEEIITPQEIMSLENADFSADQFDKIKSRLKGYVYYNNQLYDRVDLQKVLSDNGLVLGGAELSLSKEERKIMKKEFKGMSAFRGKVQGMVRLILQKSQFSEFKEGEILVTEMTSPDFFPVMKKAAAFITDEGGITCHAAIVARELKKPCIIGTQVATTVLKTGDVVEVDADKGRVIMLQSSNK